MDPVLRLFVACVAIHVPIGLRNILVEWLRLGRRAASCIGWPSA